jgi:hypothetical protein
MEYRRDAISSLTSHVGQRHPRSSAERRVEGDGDGYRQESLMVAARVGAFGVRGQDQLQARAGQAMRHFRRLSLIGADAGGLGSAGLAGCLIKGRRSRRASRSTSLPPS